MTRVRRAGLLPAGNVRFVVRRRVEPDPETWWEQYGHRVDGPRHHNGVDPRLPPVQRPPSGRYAVSGPPPAAHRRTGAGMPVQRAPLDRPEPPRHASAAELAGDAILRSRPDVAASGWRRAVRLLTGGVIRPGPGAAELRRREVLHRIRRPLLRPHHVAVMSMKGGVGKTTVATLLGLVFAVNRGDRVVALDANPDAGTLADRLTGESAVTVRELLHNIGGIRSWTDVSHYTSLAGRLQVLASEQDPAAGVAFSRGEYERVCEVLDRFFNIVITDSGTGLVHSAMEGVLRLTDGLIVVGAPTVDGASRASKTLDWLQAHGYGALAADSVAVLSADRSSGEVDIERIRAHFAARCRAVVEIPHDPHLAIGGRVDLGRLRPATREAVDELAALMADRFVF